MSKSLPLNLVSVLIRLDHCLKFSAFPETNRLQVSRIALYTETQKIDLKLSAVFPIISPMLHKS